MHDPPTHEREFVEALPHLEAVIRHVGRRFRLSPEDIDDLGSQVKLRLVEDDYRIFRKFERRSSLRTYLTTVVTRLFLDERIRLWGKWRPSSEARRLGPLAVALECLLTRDGLTIREAIETLRGRDPTCSEATLLGIFDRLPIRPAARRLVDDADLVAMADPGPASDHLVVLEEARAALHAARRALDASLAGLSARDRLLLELRYRQGCRVSDIARVVQQEQKPLYRHFDQLLAVLRRELEARGLSASQIDDLFRDGIDETAAATETRIAADVSVTRDDGETRPDSVAG